MDQSSKSVEVLDVSFFSFANRILEGNCVQNRILEGHCVPNEEFSARTFR